MEYSNHQRTQLTKRSFRSNKSLASSSLNSSNSSISSSVILSMCPLAINEDQFTFLYNTTPLTKTNSDPQLICERCRKIKKSNQCEQCKQSDKNQFTVRSNSLRFVTSEVDVKRKYSIDTESNFSSDDKLSIESKSKKKSCQKGTKRLLNIEPKLQLPTDSCLNRLVLQPEIINETKPIKSLPTQPIYIPVCIHLSSERLQRFKQRQTELDHSITRLINQSPNTANENLSQVSKYWSRIKQISLEKYHPSTYNFQLFDYLLKSTYSSKQFDIDFEENDEIKAALDILSRTLNLIEDKYSFCMINQLFNTEENTMKEDLCYQYEVLLSSFRDELSFIRERSSFYQSNLNEENRFNWIQLIQIDYPFLIEKISTDFMIKIPQIEQILIQMIRNVNKQLLKNYIENKEIHN